MLHTQNQHAKLGDYVTCVYDGCSKIYNNSNSLRRHYTGHKQEGSRNLKSVNTVVIHQSSVETVDSPKYDELVPDSETNISEVTDDLTEVDYSTKVDDIGMDFDESDHELEDDSVFMMAYCDFLNRLVNFQFISLSAVNHISTEYLKNYSRSNNVKIKSLRKSLMENVPEISELQMEKILNDVENNDPFLQAQHALDTEHKRSKYLKSHFLYIEPIEHILNQKAWKEKRESKASFYHIPVDETIKCIAQDYTFMSMTDSGYYVNEHSDGLYHDIKDGAVYKNSSYFNRYPDALVLMMYSDGVELVNPLGASRGKNKVINIFLTLADIPKSQRSKIDRIFLVAVVREKLAKKFGLHAIFKPIIDGLKRVEEGVTVYHPYERIIRGR